MAGSGVFSSFVPRIAVGALLVSAACSPADARTVTFTVDGDNAMRFTLYRASKNPDAPWESLQAEPISLKARRGNWSRRTEYWFNAKLPEATFATMDDLGRWQEVLAKRQWRDPARTTLRIVVRPDGDVFRFYVDGVYLNYLPRDGQDAHLMNFKIEKGFPLALDIAVESVDPRFETVDITGRANAYGLPGRTARTVPGETVTVGGVPFLFSRDPRRDNVDLSMSWNPGAFRTGYAACHARNRWPDPLAKTPMRYQFRVPGRDYDALYVLCAADPKKKTAVPRFTAQFHRWRGSYSGSGRPFNFPAGAVPVSTNGALTVVKIPLSGEMITEFGPEEYMNFELTKDVHPYRTYADPLNHSWHAGGLPSSVRVFGVTLSRPPVTCSFDPLRPANIFTEGETVGYAVTLENTTDAPRTEKLRLVARDWYGKDAPVASAEAVLAPGGKKRVVLTLAPARFGWYRATLEAAGRTWRHTFVHLRARDYTVRPFEEKCIRAGTWNMLASPLYATITGKGGWDTSGVFPHPNVEKSGQSAELEAVMRRYGMRTFHAPGNIRAQNGITAATPLEEGCALYRRKMPDPAKRPENEFSTYRYVSALAEPGGLGTGNAQFPEWYGEPENAYDYRRLEGTAKTRFLDYKRQIAVAHKVLRGMYPSAKLLIPHGSWNFLVPYLQDPDTRKLADGVQMDFQFYTRLPEQQLHQSSLTSITILKSAWEKFRPGEEMFMVWGEGPDVTQVYPGGSSEVSAAANRVRISMLMAAYGCNIQTSWGTNPVTHGENHCSGGLVTGNHALDPDLHYAAFSAWLRHVRHATHESYSETGSMSAFCQNFRDHRTGGLIRGIWTIRGERPFVFDCPPEKLTVYDPMDNVVPAEARDGKAVVRAGSMPVFVYGAEGVALTLGESDHGDVKPAPVERRLGELGAMGVVQTPDADDLYVSMMPEYIRRFPVKMDVAPATDPVRPGAHLSVGLPPQKTDRMTMPYFTCLTFPKPVPIPGKAQALRLDVKAASDWGRVVYVLKDAAGRRWYSCGRKGEWNADDMEGDSCFCFDGWRTLRFELPYNEPWDGFRNLGFTNWGADELKAKVVLPLALEKMFVERRSGVIYGCRFRRFAKDTPVLLGTLSAEYAREADTTPAAYADQRIAAPKVFAGQLVNPIADLAKSGTLPPGRIVSVKDPDTWFDGTRGVFTFEMPADAVAADMWMSMYPDGRGALRLGKNLKSSPAQVGGFLSGTEFYAFLVWRDAAGNVSKPSEPFKYRLVDHFGHQ